MRRFDALAASLAGLLLLLTLGVLWRGDQTTYEPRIVTPPDEAADVSTRTPIALRYERDLDGRSLGGRLRLEPEDKGWLSVSGSEAHWYPRAALAPEAAYSVVVEPGVHSLGGERQGRERRFTFRTRAPRLLVADRDSSGLHLAAVSLDGAAQALASFEPTARDLAPSPDGDRLAYVAGAEDGPADDRLWVLDLRSGARVAVAEPAGLALGHPTWSPDGQQLVYERRDPAAEVVERLDLNAPPRALGSAGRDGRPLGTIYGRPGAAAYLPTFSPFAGRLAFFEPNYRAIVVFQGGTLLTSIPWSGGTLHAWSPDEQHLLVTEVEAGPSDPARTVARVLGLEGGPARTLTPPASSDRAPAWSPDGASIALVRSGPGGAGVWIVAPDGGDAQPVLVDEAWVYGRPAWSADGRWLAFGRLPREATGQPPEVWITARDGPPRLLAHAPEVVAWLP